MECRSKFFNELSTEELFQILRARMAVFVVEQNCVYQDADEKDRESLHVSFWEDGQILAYLRIFRKDEQTATVRIGRVLTLRRGEGLGMRLLLEGIRQAKEKLNAERIYLEAQCYAIGFYEKAGFTVCSEPFIEDGIPHIQMIREL